MFVHVMLQFVNYVTQLFNVLLLLLYYTHLWCYLIRFHLIFR